MKPLLDRVRSGEILVADGAMGTLLMRRGLLTGRCPEEVNLTHPAALEEIARQYLEAGAEIIQTNTFGGSPLKLAMNGLDGRTEEINRRAVQAARRGVGDRAYVAASCGPSGRMLQPHGDLDSQVLYDSFRRQIAALVEAGADAVCVETMIDLDEAKAAVRAAKDVSPKTPVMATMTFDATPRGFYTVMGVSVEAAAAGLALDSPHLASRDRLRSNRRPKAGAACEGLAEAGADIVGANCGNGIENMVRIAAEFRRHTRLPILIQSNAGLPVMQDGKPEWPETPEFMASKVPELLAAGASIIGGCCGTTPEHIRAIRQAVDAHQNPACRCGADA